MIVPNDLYKIVCQGQIFSARNPWKLSVNQDDEIRFTLDQLFYYTGGCWRMFSIEAKPMFGEMEYSFSSRMMSASAELKLINKDGKRMIVDYGKEVTRKEWDSKHKVTNGQEFVECISDDEKPTIIQWLIKRGVLTQIPSENHQAKFTHFLNKLKYDALGIHKDDLYVELLTSGISISDYWDNPKAVRLNNKKELDIDMVITVTQDRHSFFAPANITEWKRIGLNHWEKEVQWTMNGEKCKGYFQFSAKDGVRMNYIWSGTSLHFYFDHNKLLRLMVKNGILKDLRQDRSVIVEWINTPYELSVATKEHCEIDTKAYTATIINDSDIKRW